MSTKTLPIIDVHTHLAGLGHGDTRCFISEKKFNSALYRLMRYKLGVYNAHKENRLDQAYLERLDQDVACAIESHALHAVVVFAHERIYSDTGELQRSGQELYVPNEYAFACCERQEMRGRFLPAMSVHPYRADAIDETEKWIERGAVAMKWLPNSQNMNPSDPRCLRIYDLLARHDIPLIAHTGGEHTVSILRAELGDPALLRPALDRGVKVIVAHCGTKSGLFDTNWLPRFCELARAYPNCWGDTSAFCTPGRTRWMTRILRESDVVEKLIHGSDYPVPPAAWTSLFKLGWRRTCSLQRTWSFLERDIAIKREYGFPERVFTNAARVLPASALQRWGVAC
ncbi:MAG TPA: amidohydrolase family protein [Planctomycetota bacterium]|nr:amidohydrolase family protein [Planctomycetota bacterium]